MVPASTNPAASAGRTSSPPGQTAGARAGPEDLDRIPAHGVNPVHLPLVSEQVIEEARWPARSTRASRPPGARWLNSAESVASPKLGGGVPNRTVTEKASDHGDRFRQRSEHLVVVASATPDSRARPGSARPVRLQARHQASIPRASRQSDEHHRAVERVGHVGGPPSGAVRPVEDSMAGRQD
jgi:hypothetical protein